jgi:hypothetical protein
VGKAHFFLAQLEYFAFFEKEAVDYGKIQIEKDAK